jgi:PKD repeat protein
MRRIPLLLMFFLLIVLSSLASLKASHIWGTHLTYECINPCTTRFIFNDFVICQSQPGGGHLLTITGPQGCTAPAPIGNAIMSAYFEVTPICPSVATQCTQTGSNIYGWWQVTTYRDYNTCNASPCQFNVSWDYQIHGGQTSITFPNIWYRAGETILDLSLPSCNNSPQFTSPNFMQVCINMPFIASVGAMDPDGDSLVYSLDTLEDVQGIPLPFNPGYSFAQPIGPNWAISLDSMTGILTIVPNPGSIEVASILVHVDEYRNGIKIGGVDRVFDFMTMNCTGNNAPTLGPLTNVSGATVNGYDVFVCEAGNPICLDIAGSDVDPGQNLLLTWNQGIAAATFTKVGNTNVQDSIPGTSNAPVAGRFCWANPTVGVYSFKVKIQDEACPYYAYTERNIFLQIGIATAPIVSVTSTSCPSTDFSVSVCGPGPMSYQWSGAGGLSSNSAQFSHAYASAGTYPWQLIVSNGANTDTLSGTVQVGSPAFQPNLLTGTNFVAPCVGNLYDTLDAGAGWSTYTWSTGDSTQEIVVFLGGNYLVTVTDQQGCAYFDSTTLYWASPQVFGVVTTHDGDPLQNQRVLLIEHDTLAQTLTAVDSTWTDSLGYYYFCNVTDSVVTLKATPRFADYPLELPTYADTSLYWNQAIWFHPLQNAPIHHDFSTLAGENWVGPGFIGGLITLGANKNAAIGDPIPGVRVFLRDRNTGAILGYRDSDLNGYFSFPNLPLGDYEIVPDRPLVSTGNVPQVGLTAQTPLRDSLNLQMHRYWLELVLEPNGIPNLHSPFSVHVSPNPFGNTTYLALNLEETGSVVVELHDLLGRNAGVLLSGELAEGEHRIAFGEELASGLYFVVVRASGAERTLRVVKH